MDRRELILVRLLVILQGIPGVTLGARNRGSVSGKAQPALVMHDAVEEATEISYSREGVHYAYKALMRLSPQIYILLGNPSDVIGSDVSAMRQLLVPAIWTDPTLRGYCGSNGDVRYIGCGLTTETGETREARLDVKFEFIYVLSASELAGP